jgi:hypothetical protein
MESGHCNVAPNDSRQPERAKTNKMMPDDEIGNDNSMTEADMMVEFMDLMSQEDISDYKLRKILAYVERVLSEAN